MVVKRRFLLAVATAVALSVTAVAPVAAVSYKEAKPSPLRKDNMLRVRDIAANGQTGKGAIVAVGWRQSSKPAKLFLAFSTNGGRDYRRTNGNLRKYPILGDGKLGMSLAICSGRVWAGSAFKNPGDAQGNSDVFLTTRTIGGGADQRFMTDTADDHKIRDVQVACAGKGLIAIAWLEQVGGKSKAKLLLRSDEPLSQQPSFLETYNLGNAVYGDGIDVAATADAVHVVWTKGSKRHVRLKRFEVSGSGTPTITPNPTTTVAFKDARLPQIAARGKRVVVAYTDAGKVKAKLSKDRGAHYGKASKLIGNGTVSRPSRTHSVDTIGTRIVIEASANKKGTLTPRRIQSNDLGSSWNSREFGHNGSRVGALLRKKNKPTRLMEAWYNNGSVDTLRASYETS